MSDKTTKNNNPATISTSVVLVLRLRAGKCDGLVHVQHEKSDDQFNAGAGSTK